jgi:hypothetical protein
VPQPYANHNGGGLVFGPDGMLYIGFGDGGSGGDPQGNGQALGSLLGKMLRLDVARKDPGREYAVPPDNPFVGKKDVRSEIFAYGLRNPWRYPSIQRDGSSRAMSARTRGKRSHSSSAARTSAGTRAKVPTASPKDGCRTVGGRPAVRLRSFARSQRDGRLRVHGEAHPDARGAFRLRRLRHRAPLGAQATGLGEARQDDLSRSLRLRVPTFGRDADGEIYAADFGPGGIHRLVAR